MWKKRLFSLVCVLLLSAYTATAYAAIGPPLLPPPPTVLTPTRVLPPDEDEDWTWVSVEATFGASFAIRSDGSLWAWGENRNGQLGTNKRASWSSDVVIRPIQILDDVVAVSAGGNHTTATQTDGVLWTWGDNRRGQLGVSTFGNQGRSTPVWVLQEATAVSVGNSHTVTIRIDDSLWAWATIEMANLEMAQQALTRDP